MKKLILSLFMLGFAVSSVYAANYNKATIRGYVQFNLPDNSGGCYLLIQTTPTAGAFNAHFAASTGGAVPCIYLTQWSCVESNGATVSVYPIGSPAPAISHYDYEAAVWWVSSQCSPIIPSP